MLYKRNFKKTCLVDNYKYNHCSQQDIRNADVVELVDTLDLGSSASRRESSSLSIRTINLLCVLPKYLSTYFFTGKEE